MARHWRKRDRAFAQVLENVDEGAVSAAQQEDVASEIPPLSPGPRSASGVPLVVAAAFCFSIHGATVRYSSDAGFSTLQLSFYVGLVRLIIGLGLLPFRRKWWPTVFCSGHAPSFAALVASRNIVGCGALVLIFSALRRLPVGEATSVVFTAPVWTTILAYFFLGEKVTRYSLAATVLAVLGVSLIATGSASSSSTDSVSEAEAFAAGLDIALDVHPATDEGPLAGYSQRSIGLACALSGALCLSLVMVTTRQIGLRMPAVVSIGWYGFCLWSFALVAAVLLDERLVPPDVPNSAWCIMLGSASLSFLAQCLNTMALQRLEAGPVQVLGTLEIVFSFVWQASFLHTPLSARSALGALTIIRFVYPHLRQC
mmetsp:Transcript_15275/g.35536  ORF Transcript_15275/g.35536 Transcript_15275/m.35536 type:complete len:370 (+) Transcript_15275:111-1220(+)